MADVKISELTAGASLSGSETVPVVQSATTVRTTAQDIANLAPVTSVAGKTGVVTIQEADITDFGTYLTSETSHADVVVDGDFASTGLMKRGATAGSYSIVTDNSSNWNTAYGWGDHSAAGYSTFSGSYTDLTNKPTLFDGTYSSLTGTPTIPAALTDLGISDGSSGQVLTTNGAGTFTFTTVSGGGGIALTDLSVSVAAAGTANLSYNNTNGTFTYTPPDLSSYSTFSGSYTDLTNKPTIPADVGDLTDTGGLLFDGAYSSLTGTPTIPSALTDLGITDGTSGQVLTTNGSGTFTFTTVSGGGGASAIDDLTDVDTSTTAPTDGQALVWNNTNSEWVPGTSGIGVGQTWQDMTSSRSAGVTYTNTTGKSIYVAIYFYRASGALRDITVDGFYMRSGTTASQNGIVLTCIIPNGSTYECSTIDNLVGWYELR